jgi:glutathione S-transferase
MTQTAPYIFHAADVSYFSGKVRPALIQKGLHWSEVQPRMREIVENTGVAFIPVLVTPEGEYWQDTSEILDRLEERVPEPPLFPSTPVQRIAAYLIELYGDELGLLPAMHYRWSFADSVAQVRSDFGANMGDMERANQFADRMAGSLPMLGVTDETGPLIEAHLRELLDALSAHFETHDFLLGARMSLADCGLMGPFYGHLYRDAVPGRLLRETALPVCTWLQRMTRPDPARQGEWLADDALAPTLGPVLRAMADGVSVLVDSVNQIDEWADENAKPGETPGRVLGLSETHYRGGPLRTGLRPYTLWMAQRTLDAYAALTSGERARVDTALAQSGWEPLLALSPRHRLEKRKNELVWA